MEKELDSILQILERASTIEDYKELNQIEQQLQQEEKDKDKEKEEDDEEEEECNTDFKCC